MSEFCNARLLGRSEKAFSVAENGNFASFHNDCSGEDLGGAWVLPAFVDSHCHILPTGLDLLKLDLEGLDTKAAVLDAVRDAVVNIEPGKWLHAVHYDQNRFEDGVHLTKNDLDLISSEVPILLRHVNGHAGVANSASLNEAGVDKETADPKGGEYVRDSNGVPNGILLETALEWVTNRAPHPTLEEMVDAILRAGEAMASLGVTHATDMMTGRWNLLRELEAYRLAAEQGCAVKLRLCLQWSTVFGPRAVDPSELQEALAQMDGRRCKAIGIKIFADGAIGSATAAINGRYVTTGDQGTLIYTPERLNEMVLVAHKAGWSVAIHSIGDRSTNHVLEAFATTGEPQRHRLEHAMILSDEQVDWIKRLGVPVTMQPEFLHRFGHAYKRQLGEEKASRLKRFRSVLDAGIPMAFNSDRPIVLGDPLIGIRTAANRPSGFEPSENILIEEAFDCYTRHGATLNGEPERYGELKVGQYADFTVWDKNPLVDTEGKLLRTISH